MDGALLVLQAVRRVFPFIERIFADGGYQGDATAAAVQALSPWNLQIIKRSDQAVAFQVLPMGGAVASPRTTSTGPALLWPTSTWP